MCFIPIQNTNVFFYKKNLFLATNVGIDIINLNNFLPFLNIILHSNSIELKVINNCSKIDYLKIQLFNIINLKIANLNNVIKKKLVLFGIGFRSWTYMLNTRLNCMILKVGFSRDISIEIPKSIVVISLKPTLILLKSINKYKLSQFVSSLRSVRKPDVYKAKGVQYLNEKINLKLGKNN
uniref:Ribosomal protein L6 n=1 Tax=Cryptomonas curvata TaxID=233186 RepID=A0A2P1G8F8_9CRYP|nr:ribosomal protein L6 [Cryptomonas curvata]AVM81244.1 ribosomal protein L6 [Cryptomonas curvata]